MTVILVMLALMATASVGAVVVNLSSSSPDADNLLAPNNLVVFPERDFLTVEGFAEFAGAECTVTVYRPVTQGSSSLYNIIGQAREKISGADVAFEVNHPGGACWGQRADLQVTPDILEGDRIQLVLEGLDNKVIADVVVKSGKCTSTSQVVSNGVAFAFTVTGTFGSDVAGVENMEQRIVNPDLTDLTGKRSLRAVAGPPTTTDAENGMFSITSALTVTTNQFTATYTFTPNAPTAAFTAAEALAAARISAETAAAGGGNRLMAWHTADTAGNRMKLTIAEMGEAGGPGMGGCPSGPAGLSPSGTTAVLSTSTTSSSSPSVTLRWAGSVNPVGAPQVTDYMVVLQWDGQSDFTGRFVSAADPLQATFDNLPGLPDTVMLRPMAGTVVGSAYTISSAAALVSSVPDKTAPGLSLLPSGGENDTTAIASNSVSVSAPSGTQVFYTLDGSSPIKYDTVSVSAIKLGGVPSPTITISGGPTHVRVVVVDADGLYTVKSGYYKPEPRPALPEQSLSIAAIPGGVTLTWAMAAGGSLPAGTSSIYYIVRKYTPSPSIPEADIAGDMWKVDADNPTTAGEKMWTQTEELFATSSPFKISPLVAGQMVYYAVFPKYVDQSGPAGPGSLIRGAAPTVAEDAIVITRTTYTVSKRTLRVRGTVNALEGKAGGRLQVVVQKGASAIALGTATAPSSYDSITGIGDFDFTVSTTALAGGAIVTSDRVYVKGTDPFTGESPKVAVVAR